ncbi:MAG TPA: PAC2 family protein [Sedimentisphaerales bacterium]|nr:PAC2 family protein [Sedimentisphaerales bacterium]
MGIKLYKEPELNTPIMLCGWPGIGNIGISAIDSLRGALKAQEFGEIEPLDFFEPRKVVIERGLLKDLQFPSSKFYFQRIKNQDLIFFIGQEQPTEGRTRYAEGKKAYKIANLVLDVAEKFGCRRVYTSGAAVTQIHHTVKPRVWAVPNKQSLIKEIKEYENTIVMSEIDRRSSQGTITGLNGLLLGVARKRGLEAVCLMGEIPYYLQGAPWPYPRGSKSVLEVLTKILDVEVDLSQLDELARTVEENIEEFLESLYNAEAIPPQVRDEIEKLRYARPAEPGPITEEEQKKMMEHIDELFKEGGPQDEKHL